MTLREIENAIQQLSDSDFRTLQNRIRAHPDPHAVDAQLAQAAAQGKFDKLIEEAEADAENGRLTDL